LFPCFQLILEIRKRLGAVNGYIPGFPNTTISGVIDLNDEGSEIECMDDAKNVVVKFPWPTEELGPVSRSGLHNVLNHQNGAGITFRLRLSKLEASGMAIMNVKNPNFRRNFKKPCIQVEIEEGSTKVQVYCSKCKTEAASLSVQRWLPLPSMDWRGSAQDWFCGCNHGMSSKGCENNEKQSNRNLQASQIGPNPHDVLHSYSFVLLNSDHFNHGTQLNCKSCHSSLGEIEEKQKTAKLWHHRAVISDNPRFTVQPNLAETFLLLVGGICIENDWSTIKVKLGQNDETTSGSLVIWILESDLSLMTVGKDVQSKSVMKVLFQNGDSCDLQCDSEVCVPEEIIKEGFKILETSQDFIPVHQRHDATFNIGYIDFQSVLSSFTTISK
jgi:hypothetical protein